jgi:chaperonin cofactor prefoldin
MNLQGNFPEIFTSIGLPTILGYLIYWLINKKKVKSEGDLKAADYVDKLLDIGTKQLNNINVEFDHIKKVNLELVKQNTLIVENSNLLIKENSELRKSISELKSRVNDLEKREQTLKSENVILTKQIGDLVEKLKKHEERSS